MKLAPWWERWNGLLDEEMSALSEAGIRFELDEEAKERHGVIRLRVYPVVSGREVELLATYSDLFPYFRFEVQGPDLSLPHHQHPFGGNLCLIGRSTENWEVDDTLAGFLTERLPKTLQAGASENLTEAEGLEQHQAEPYTDYYSYPHGAALLVDSGWTINGTKGQLKLGLEPSLPGLVRGAVLEVQDLGGNVLAQADPAIPPLYPTTIRGRWVRAPEPISEGEPSKFLEATTRSAPDLGTPHWQRVGKVRVDVVGVVFPEEVAWRQIGDGWVFVVRFIEG